MLKNNQLLIHINNLSQKVFLKFCCIFLLIFIFSCKQDASKKTTNAETTTPDTEINQTENNNVKTIVFFGDSLTAGYGLDDVNDAFPGIIQQKIDSLQLNYSIVNSGVSGETTSGGKNRIDWVLNQKPTIFILELGANDGLRGVPLKQSKENLQDIIDAVKKKYPETIIVLAGMQIPPNMGQEYTTEFKNMFPDLATKNDLYLVPFLLENVGGISDLNQKDGIHPTKEGHQILAKNVWTVLKPILK
ncbi:arylesterase [Polaribacter sp. R2A056_3_33]|uniref:arylesterase n=1 Tax=Polaribacter sp. R2A056_3_33 TaxID=2745563 RepID=UPI001C4F4954|nr:arylesterase [Polaribacter sp. R2A056_3_33]QXP69954.1 arylesterase [Polaribacter sp. R2A056_3_33]